MDCFSLFLILLQLLLVFDNLWALKISHTGLCRMKNIRWSLNANVDSDDSYGKPAIVSYDFAREDILSNRNSSSSTEVNSSSLTNDNAVEINIPSQEVDDDTWVPSRVEDIEETSIAKFLKDVYVGTPYDSSKKQQARFVVRSITALSFIIGVIFTAVWYLFPGQFISYKKDSNYLSRYNYEVLDPSDLLSPNEVSIPGVVDSFISEEDVKSTTGTSLDF